MMRRFAFLLAALTALASPANAQSHDDERQVIATLFASNMLILAYGWSDCPWECHVVQVNCSDGSPYVLLADVSGPVIAEWFDFDAVNPVFPTAELRVGAVTTELVFQTLSFGDMNGTWWVELAAPNSDWLGELVDAEFVEIITPAFSTLVPNLPNDRPERAAFVEACLAR